MMASSVINLILSIFGISVSSIFILFWCGRVLCAHILLRRSPQAGALLLPRTATSRRVERNSNGVNPLVIAYFPTLRFNEDMYPSRQDAMCAVCLGEYKEDELLRCLPQCGHTFHVNCIDAWLQQHATCPVCRMSLQGYFVGRLVPRLQSMPVNDQLGGGLRSFSEHSEALTSELQPIGGNVTPVQISTHDNSSPRNGACEVSGSTLQRHIPSNDAIATERLDSHGENLGPNRFVERS